MILLHLVPQALHREVLCAVRMDKYCGNAQKQLAETLHCASFISARCIVKRQTEPQITVQNLNIKHALRRGVILTNIDSFDLHPIHYGSKAHRFHYPAPDCRPRQATYTQGQTAAYQWGM